MVMPTAGSTASASVPRPAPSATAARPTDSASKARDGPAARRRDPVLVRGVRQAPVVVDDPRIATLVLDDAPEGLDAAPRGERPADGFLGGVLCGGDAGEDEHPGGEQHREVFEIGGPVALQRLDALDDLVGVAHFPAERGIHPGHDRFGPDARRIADRHQRLRQPARVLERLHERAAARLDVEDEGADALGDLLAHDRRRDQRDALDRAGDVAQRVQPPVGRGDLGGLADQRAADGCHGRPEFLQRKRGAEAGNRFELVERAAGVAEAAARHHRHRGAARNRQRREDQRRLVADAAGAVLVDGNAELAVELDADAGSHHRVGELRGLVGRHAAQHDRHQQRGGLIVGNGAVGDARDEIFDLAATECSAVALAADNVDRSHSGNNIRMTAPERGTATIAPEIARRVGHVASTLVAAGRSGRAPHESCPGSFAIEPLRC